MSANLKLQAICNFIFSFVVYFTILSVPRLHSLKKFCTATSLVVQYMSAVESNVFLTRTIKI